MWVHYTKLALKVLWRRKVFTSISLFGIGFTLMGLLVMSAMIDHLLAPRSPETRLARILHVSYVSLEGKDSRSNGGAGYGFLDRYVRGLPGVERMAIVSEPQDVNGFVSGEKVISKLRYADDEFWNVLDFDFVEGAPYGAEDEKGANQVAVISETTRRKYFGDAKAAGRTIEVGGASYRVVGVVRDVPFYRTAAAGDIWAPVSTNRTPNFREQLRGGFIGLLLARSRSDFPTIRAEFASRLQRVQFPDDNYNVIRGVPMTRFQELVRQVAYSEPEKPATARAMALLTGAALLFMLLPTINLVNINVSRIFERSSEIGVRKAFGASSRRLVWQFVFENVILCLVGAAIGLVGAVFLLAWINGSGLLPHAEFGINGRVFAYGFVLAVFFGCLSGVYPAWRMARLHPVAALRGDTR
ncbi:MAG TPA: FtsX-like permease family protein [Candidatus Krumholzibacteria bacterium]|nr:FtsX-like permease family protein [Candidatus Krumholzibacteria bacterium]